MEKQDGCWLKNFHPLAPSTRLDLWLNCKTLDSKKKKNSLKITNLKYCEWDVWWGSRRKHGVYNPIGTAVQHSWEAGGKVQQHSLCPLGTWVSAGNGAHVASGSGNEWSFSVYGRLRPHCPRQKVVALLQHQPGKFFPICVCGMGHATELWTCGEVLLVHPAMILKYWVFSERTFVQRRRGAR